MNGNGVSVPAFNPCRAGRGSVLRAFKFLIDLERSYSCCAHPIPYCTRSRLQTHPHHLADLAAFLGLNCTPEEAEDVFQRHTYANPPGDYTTYGLSTETLAWMNATMSKTLPETMLARYGLTPIWE